MYVDFGCCTEDFSFFAPSLSAQFSAILPTAVQLLLPGFHCQTPLLLPFHLLVCLPHHPVDVGPWIMFWCFPQTYNWAQPKQTFVNSYASGHPPPFPHLPSCLSPALTLRLHSLTSIQRRGYEWPRCKWCHMWLPLFIKLTQARLRSRPLPATGPAHYSQYLHAILNCWEFPWWREPPLHEIFRPRGDSREAPRRVFTPIWLYDMIFSWAMTVPLN